MSESLPYSGVAIVDVIRYAVVTQAWSERPCRSSPMVRIAVATSRHRDPDHRRRPARPLAPGLGDHRVPDHVDDRHAAVRQALGHLRPQAAVPVLSLIHISEP